ncbi:putative esterase [Kribbella flavida DSM 17836]|uniref:Putative esterase n=1 Tax=Kribbella flavida (strain DSM 17836 / JCM 10339 / NBRC 14399) TaxID=479435 RepID=D2PKH8_KRIFD|nr:alpha/beta hydrolase-fold protein [Kribbella flavida]ADB30490.1 putative esterase [Kribbella flavida DSM 17836]
MAVGTVAGLETGILPGRARVHGVLGLTGEDGVVPDVPAGPVVSGTFRSTARRTTVGWSVIYPHGQRADARLPVVLVLHGRGGDHTSAVNDLGADRYLSDVVRSGTPPFALATVDGGQDTYWHRRSSGEDPQRMLTTELLPLLAKRGLRTDQYGVLGWSMGGYGALLHAGRGAADSGGRAVAAGAISPALWRHAGDAADGAFDGAEDFAAHQVLGHPDPLKEVALRIDCGRDDPFAGAVRELRDEVAAAGGIQPGAHTAGYWRRMLPDQLRFLGTRPGR